MIDPKREPKREIDELRQDLARLDAQLLTSLEQRARLSKRIGDLLRGEPAVAPQNERAQIEELVARATGAMPEDSLREIFRHIWASCRALERPACVAFIGAEGGVGHAVARLRFGAGATFVSCKSSKEAVAEVASQRATFAVVPYETLLDGPVQSTLSAITASDLRIVSSFDGESRLCLMNLSGNVDDIQKIYVAAEDRVLAPELAKMFTTIPTLDVNSPHAACEIAKNDGHAAALASEIFGTEHGLEVARRNVDDIDKLRVRYAVLATRPSARTGNDRTAISLSIDHEPGALLRVLTLLSERGINLTKVHSRPLAGEAWDYIYYLEIVGHLTDRHIVMAIEEVRRLAKFFKVLGSYPA